MTDYPRRPLHRSDYERAYVVIHALQCKAVFRDDRVLWEILYSFHNDYLGEISRSVPLDELVGEEAVNREVTHALIVLESLMRGLTDISARPTKGVMGVCAAAGCPHVTHAELCWHHELDQSGEE